MGISEKKKCIKLCAIFMNDKKRKLTVLFKKNE